MGYGSFMFHSMGSMRGHYGLRMLNPRFFMHFQFSVNVLGYSASQFLVMIILI